MAKKADGKIVFLISVSETSSKLSFINYVEFNDNNGI